MYKQLNFIDLFSGAGGLSEGFTNAGYAPIAHVEMDKYACNTLKTRACYHYLHNMNQSEIYKKYLRGEITREQLYKFVPEIITDSVINVTMSESTMELIYQRIDSIMKRKGQTRVSLIIGGPPCQAYSLAGRARKCMKNDPRNELYKLYCKVLVKYDPEMFVFENVPGLLTAGRGKYIKKIKNTFQKSGYDIDYKIINAMDFGVLQKRQRVILIGWKSGTNYSYPEFYRKELNACINDILSDLPRIQAGESSFEYESSDFSNYLKENCIRGEDDILTWHVARYHNARDREIYRHVIKAWNRDRFRLKYTDLPDNLCTHKNRTGFLDRFKVVASDLTASHTLTAHIAKDGHYYIHPDLEQARSITVREAARIQSFPDNYFFEGSRTSAFTQIGNAVPPLMAKGIAEAISYELLNKNNYYKKASTK
jgi:DNA (cytosine-5)-methyltransferase 1